MSKKRANAQKKRRTKRYSGEDAAVSGTKVTRVTAPERSRLGEWFHDNKRRLLAYAVIVAIVTIFYFLFSWLFSIVF